MGSKETSKFMSLILRHKPEIINISLDEHGWANVDELIAGIVQTNDFNKDILEEIVRTDEKQRYSFNEDKTLIRANQGHSIPVDVELDEAEPPAELWHGTGEIFSKAAKVWRKVNTGGDKTYEFAIEINKKYPRIAYRYVALHKERCTDKFDRRRDSMAVR